MGVIADNLAKVEARIAAACAKAGRRRDEVTLVAVSKLHPPEAIAEAYAAGARHFGENYAQELRDKSAVLSNLAGIRWHAIGPLQANKAKYVAKTAHYFHALESKEIAQELSKRRTGGKLTCFLEINVAGEASKSGVAPDAAAKLLDETRALPNLEIAGLMCLPPLDADPRPHFERIAALARTLGLRELSIGSTADYEIAIACGTTFVRVGTAIFGERPK